MIFIYEKMGKHYLLIVLLIIFEIGLTNGLQKPKIGGTINVCAKCNFRNVMMMIDPPNSKILEFSTSAFQNINSTVHRPDRPLSDDDFNIKLCDNKDELLAAYFTDFRVQGHNESWRLYADNWNEFEIAKLFGIPHVYLRDDYKFILVKLIREHMSEKIITPFEELTLLEYFTTGLHQIEQCDDPAFKNFIRTFGTHYTDSYATGDFIYQVFVYNQTNYNDIKSYIGNRSIHIMSDYSRRSYFSPWYALRIGKIRSASGNKTLENLLATFNQDSFTNSKPYTNIMMLSYRKITMGMVSESLNDKVLLKLDLRSLLYTVPGLGRQLCLTFTVKNECKYRNSLTFDFQSTDKLPEAIIGNTLDVYAKCHSLADILPVVPPKSRIWKSSMSAFKNIESMRTRSDDQLSIDDYSIKFCDTKNELLEAYFSDYRVQSSIESWKMFTHNWNEFEIARMLGIRDEYLSDEYKYILVKLTREHTSNKITLPLRRLMMNETFESDLATIQNGNDSSARNFITKHGNHYVHSYATGNFISQVFVYNSSDGKYLKILNRIGRSNVGEMGVNQRFYYFSPNYAVHIGNILSASRDKFIDDWIAEKCRTSIPWISQNSSFPSIMKFFYDSISIEELGKKFNLANAILLKLDLRLLPRAVPDKRKEMSLIRAIYDRYESQL